MTQGVAAIPMKILVPAFRYDLQSHVNQVVCAGGVWVGNDLRCVPVNCGLPDIQYARMDCPDGTNFGSRCKFDCRPPAKRIGNSDISLQSLI